MPSSRTPPPSINPIDSPNGRNTGISDLYSAPTDHDEFLSVLINNDFSSPSDYASFLNPSTGIEPLQDQPQLAPVPDRHHSSDFADSALSPMRTVAQPTASSVEGHSSSPRENQLAAVASQPDAAQSPAPGMPRPGPRPHSPTALDGGPMPKRRRLSQTSSHQPEPLALPLPLDDDDDNLFGDSAMPEDTDGLCDLPTVDLTQASGVPEEDKKLEADKRIKISAFQCAICMDDVVALTVTHCGHLFCQQCLHSSLHVSSTRGKCPMCRSKIDMKARPTYTARTKGFWPLELKLMTKTKKDKGKADAASTPSNLSQGITGRQR